MRLFYPFDLPKLPYGFSDMLPYMSEWTMKTHYTVNHQGYVNNTNKLLANKPDLQKSKLALLLTQAKGPLFDQAAQHFNHVIWWYSMQPASKEYTEPSGKLKALIIQHFGSIENWRADFIKKAKAQFGSGWCWLVFEKGKLYNVTTPNAQIPNFFSGRQPLLVCDLWEHAYFCDYTTDREKYIKGWFHCVNWKMANVRLAGEDGLFSLY